MIRAISSILAAAALSACASAPVDTPEWFDQRQAELDAQGTPSLRGIPRGTVAQTNRGYWERLERDVTAAEAQMRANPRSAPATANDAPDPVAAEAEARAILEATAAEY